MQTTTYGYRKPDIGDKAKLTSGWFETFEYNVDRLNAHSHNGTDSPLLGIEAFSPYTNSVYCIRTFTTASADTTSNKIAIIAHGFATGTSLTFSLGSGNTFTCVPTVAHAGTVYAINDGVDSLKLASSYANALAGTAIDIQVSSGASTNSLDPWVADGAGYKQVITVPAAVTEINSYNVKFIFLEPSGKAGQIAYLNYKKLTSSTFEVYCNDNTAYFTALYR